MIRNDPTPVEKPGYEPTGEGFYAECPDHGCRTWWHHELLTFYCPATERGHSLHPGDERFLAPADIYLEHNEAWRVVNGCLYIDEYDEIVED